MEALREEASWARVGAGAAGAAGCRRMGDISGWLSEMLSLCGFDAGGLVDMSGGRSESRGSLGSDNEIKSGGTCAL